MPRKKSSTIFCKTLKAMRKTVLYLLLTTGLAAAGFGLKQWSESMVHTFFEGNNRIEVSIRPVQYTFISEAKARKIVKPYLDSVERENRQAFLAERALEKNPFVENAEVYYVGRNRWKVEITQIQPLAYTDMPQGRKLMDSRGRIKPLPDDSRPRLPLIEGTASVEDARKIYPLVRDMSRDTFFARHLRRISLSRDGITLHLSGFPPVELGSMEAYRHKLEKTKEIVLFLKNNKKSGLYTGIDVRYKGQAVCKK